MKKEMTRFVIPLLALFLGPTFSFATADSPVVQGLGGAGRAGVPGEALFSNPASAALLTQSAAFLYFQKPRISDWNAGGRGYAVGVYDGQNPAAKGALGFVRTSRARIDRQGNQTFEDRSDYRFTIASSVWSNVMGGLQTRYVTRRSGAESRRFFNTDLGTIFPVYTDLMAGVTYENAFHKEEETPPTVGVGLSYSLGFGIRLLGDGYRLMKGEHKGERGWAAGGELSLASDFKVRFGRFQEAYRRLKGWSLGASWVGPRASFDYAMRTTGSGPQERDHMLGMVVAF
jgi:hypothetical protein